MYVPNVNILNPYNHMTKQYAWFNAFKRGGLEGMR